MGKEQGKRGKSKPISEEKRKNLYEKRRKRNEKKNEGKAACAPSLSPSPSPEPELAPVYVPSAAPMTLTVRSRPLPQAATRPALSVASPPTTASTTTPVASRPAARPRQQKAAGSKVTRQEKNRLRKRIVEERKFRMKMRRELAAANKAYRGEILEEDEEEDEMEMEEESEDEYGEDSRLGWDLASDNDDEDEDAFGGSFGGPPSPSGGAQQAVAVM